MHDATVAGTWFVVRTSSPFWRTRDNPTVTYTPLSDGRVVDTVRYTRRGNVRLVHGLDEPMPDGGWKWRGVTALTRLASSRWRVLHGEEEWAVTHFDRTLFTPEGWDVYARTPTLAADHQSRATVVLASVVDLGRVFVPRHDIGHDGG